MGKESGLGARYFVDQYNLSGDTNELTNISKALNPLDITGIDKLAPERLSGKLMGNLAWTVHWNPTNAHVALRAVPRSDRVAAYYHRATLGVPVAAMVCKQVTYAPNRAEDGSIKATVSADSNATWLDWGLALTAGERTDTGATNGTGVDFAAGSSFGLTAYVNVTAFTGTNCAITLQESSDNGVGDAWANVAGGAFTAFTAVGSQRLYTGNQTVERYLRAVTSGTFTSITFAVMAVINRTDVSDL